MKRISYGVTKEGAIRGYTFALKCNEQFYVISKGAYKRIKKRLRNIKPVFLTDLPVYIDGISI